MPSATHKKCRGDSRSLSAEATLGVGDFARLFGTKESDMPEECVQLISQLDFRHAVLRGKEREDVFLRVLRKLDSQLEYAGRHRKERWEDGWSENLQEFVASGYDLTKLVPKFVRPDEVIRLDGNYVMPADPGFETNFVTILRVWLFKKWFEDCDHVYEFGCGTGHNLVALAKLFPNKRLHGLDWAQSSSQIISLLAGHCGLNISGESFDMLSPDHDYPMAPHSGVFTIGAMEQLGARFDAFLDFLLRKAPRVCINVETIHELYRAEDLFDYVAAQYLEKRGYLKGYLTRLQELEAKGRIEVCQVRRTFGSLYHDGYSFIVWKPIP